MWFPLQQTHAYYIHDPSYFFNISGKSMVAHADELEKSYFQLTAFAAKVPLGYRAMLWHKLHSQASNTA